MLLTSRMLTSLQACDEALAVFEGLYPEGLLIPEDKEEWPDFIKESQFIRRHLSWYFDALGQCPKLYSLKFRGNLTELNLGCFHLDGVSFFPATLEDINFWDCTLHYCHLEDVLLSGVIESCRFWKTSFQASRLSHLSIFHSSFLCCTFSEVDFHDVTLSGCSFRNCTFSGCDLQDADFKYCSFQECYFLNCSVPSMDEFNRCIFDDGTKEGIRAARAKMAEEAAKRLLDNEEYEKEEEENA